MNFRRLFFALAILLGSLVVTSTPAEAACAPLSLCSCTVSTTGISFGSYIPVDATNNESSGTVRVQCVLLVALAGSYTIDLSTGSSGTYAQRTLRNGASILTYNIYVDAARSQILGNGSGGSSRITRNFTALLGVDQTTTVYGRIPAGQNVPAGSYSDTIIVTVTY
ncbi:spore coat protein U domain-containing protein [Sphingomonas sp. So64.6b]|uniref:Csu type fimbrial protein n=1 Tax=Sphingomonas sp. So64.6b TaxID=2997354 RepID=UPI00160321E5|nr:spore coat U domain-containing protein [Sphingomonas sp. So64.6b]QNA82842.1 spore coat protein U domain-containing protein [Sphingomonas sp. So64.6b]